MHPLYLPLYAKILLWFGLNLALLASGFYYFIRGQLDLGGTLLAGQTGNRIRNVADAFATEARASDESGWREILDRYSTTYDVELSLAGEGGEPISTVMGDMAYPAEISTMLRGRGSKPPGGRSGSPRERRPPPNKDQREFGPPSPRKEGLPPRRRGDEKRRDPDGGPDGDSRRRARPSELLFLTSEKVDDRYWFAVRVAHRYPQSPGPDTAILVGSTKSLSSSRLLPDIRPWLVFVASTLALSVLLWLPLVHRITRYLRQMTLATEAIASGQFDVSVSEDRHDELGKLGAAINRMSRRLSGYVTGQKRFLGDIAHELCSPIARMQMSLGVLERRLSGEHGEALEDLREEADHMSQMVNELLSFSRSSLRETTIQLEAIDLTDAIDLALQRETAATEEIKLNIPGTPKVLADANLLQRAIANVVRNAILYAGEAGPISIDVDYPVEGQTRLRITDSGDGVSEEALERLFDPFYRPETARTRETGGTGLGLSIVKMCMESCRGTAAVKNLEPSGFEVTLTLRSSNGL
ncbi:MAG: HAMP domain-containing protein [Verrucomicrobiae bacterium]|nr:HAMP domain-containing protein [Verrucomicrobiae bacterium]